MFLAKQINLWWQFVDKKDENQSLFCFLIGSFCFFKGFFNFIFRFCRKERNHNNRQASKDESWDHFIDINHSLVSGITDFQAKTTTAPTTMPAIAADEVIRFQNKEKSTTGPNAEPKPAQANSTSFNTLLFHPVQSKSQCPR